MGSGAQVGTGPAEPPLVGRNDRLRAAARAVVVHSVPAPGEAWRLRPGPRPATPFEERARVVSFRSRYAVGIRRIEYEGGQPSFHDAPYRAATSDEAQADAVPGLRRCTTNRLGVHRIWARACV